MNIVSFSSNDAVAEKLHGALAPVSSGNPAPARGVFEDPIFESLITLGAELETLL